MRGGGLRTVLRDPSLPSVQLHEAHPATTAIGPSRRRSFAKGGLRTCQSAATYDYFIRGDLFGFTLGWDFRVVIFWAASRSSRSERSLTVFSCAACLASRISFIVWSAARSRWSFRSARLWSGIAGICTSSGIFASLEALDGDRGHIGGDAQASCTRRVIKGEGRWGAGRDLGLRPR